MAAGCFPVHCGKIKSILIIIIKLGLVIGTDANLFRIYYDLQANDMIKSDSIDRNVIWKASI